MRCIVYCVSCAKAMFNGGKKPRYLIDLLFDEETTAETCDPVAWHKELDEFIAAHTDDDYPANGYLPPQQESR
jgi:hypothetical protein